MHLVTFVGAMAEDLIAVLNEREPIWVIFTAFSRGCTPRALQLLRPWARSLG